jgi:hypothetical protein
MKICMDFGPYDTFPSSDVPEMVNPGQSFPLQLLKVLV